MPALGSYFIPEQFGGKTLAQIQKEGLGSIGRPDLLARAFGIDENTPLQAGQALTNISNAQGGYDLHPGSAELQFVQKNFTPAAQFQQQQQQSLIDQTKARENEFLGRVQGIPDALRAIEEEIGLPGARQTFQAAGEQSRNVANQIRDVAPTQQTIAKQVGISAPRLQQRTAAETAKLAPSAEAATRGLESASSALQGLLGDFQTRTEHALTPFQIESSLLNASTEREFNLFRDQLKANLDRDLAQLQNATQLQLQELQNSGRLAEIERMAELENQVADIDFVDLGNRVGIYNQALQSFTGFEPKGKLTGVGTDTNNNPAGI